MICSTWPHNRHGAPMVRSGRSAPRWKSLLLKQGDSGRYQLPERLRAEMPLTGSGAPPSRRAQAADPSLRGSPVVLHAGAASRDVFSLALRTGPAPAGPACIVLEERTNWRPVEGQGDTRPYEGDPTERQVLARALEGSALLRDLAQPYGEFVAWARPLVRTFRDRCTERLSALRPARVIGGPFDSVVAIYERAVDVHDSA
jgi:hypothetical protein